MQNFFKKLPKKTQGICNEISNRAKSAKISLEIAEKCKNRKTTVTDLDLYDLKNIHYGMKEFALLQICSILDKESRYSLKIKKEINTYIIEKQTLEKYFPELDELEIEKIKKEIDSLLKNNTELIDKLFKARNERIAHAGKIFYEYDSESILHTELPIKKIIKFTEKIDRIFTQIFLYHINGGKIFGGKITILTGYTKIRRC